MGSYEQTFQFQEKKAHKAKSAEYRACSSIGMHFPAKNWQIFWGHFGTHFFHFQISHHFFYPHSTHPLSF